MVTGVFTHFIYEMLHYKLYGHLGCKGGIFHCPVKNIVVAGVLRPLRRSLFSPLSRFLPPPPAAVALQAHSLLRRSFGSNPLF